jgi:hypothetical protein
MVECGTWIMLWFNVLIFSMHWLINGVNGACWHVLWSKCDMGGGDVHLLHVTFTLPVGRHPNRTIV